MMGALPCRAECMDFDVHCRPCRLSPLLWSPARVLQWPAGNDGHSRSGNESAVVRATIAALSASGTGRTAQADSSVLPCFAQPLIRHGRMDLTRIRRSDHQAPAAAAASGTRQEPSAKSRGQVVFQKGPHSKVVSFFLVCRAVCCGILFFSGKFGSDISVYPMIQVASDARARLPSLAAVHLGEGGAGPGTESGAAAATMRIRNQCGLLKEASARHTCSSAQRNGFSLPCDH